MKILGKIAEAVAWAKKENADDTALRIFISNRWSVMSEDDQNKLCAQIKTKLSHVKEE